MKIGIDGNEANVERRVGISEYVYELLLAFSKLSEKTGSFHIFLKEDPRSDLPAQSDYFRYLVFGPKKLWTQIALPVKLFRMRKKPDVFFSPGHYAPRFSSVPRVISIMDLAFFHFPEYFTKKDLAQLHSWTRYSVNKAKAILTISQATKDDIIKQYNIPAARISVVYPGIKNTKTLNPHIYPMQELENKYGISSHYILFVGTLQPRKNIARLIEAFSYVLKSAGLPSHLQLVIVGRKGWNYEEILKAPEKFGVADKVKFLDFVPDEDLEQLYRNAVCFTWPSLYEGFGLPVLEAMKYDCPVITSNVSSLPEAGGDAALYVDPLDVHDISKKIVQVIEDKTLRKSMIEKGREHIKKFSWEKAAQETLAILRKVAEE